MDRKTKQQLTAHRNSLYNNKWVEIAATDGYKRFIEAFNEGVPEGKKKLRPDENRFLAILYYSAFEDALRTFLSQVLEDHVTDIKLCLDEMMNLTAEIGSKEETGNMEKEKS